MGWTGAGAAGRGPEAQCQPERTSVPTCVSVGEIARLGELPARLPVLLTLHLIRRVRSPSVPAGDRLQQCYSATEEVAPHVFTGARESGGNCQCVRVMTRIGPVIARRRSVTLLSSRCRGPVLPNILAKRPVLADVRVAISSMARGAASDRGTVVRVNARPGARHWCWNWN
jgi:hypothetical protein